MLPLYSRSLFSVRHELMIVGSVVAALLILPVLAVVSLTNVGALVPGSNGSPSAGMLFTNTANPDDRYDYGECTYWAALRRIEIGDPIPNTWGNAATWATRAQGDGYLVDHIPSIGAIMQTPHSAGGLGHVAFVERTNPYDGSWTISEMNNLGWDITNERTLSAATAANYSFIHDFATPGDTLIHALQ